VLITLPSAEHTSGARARGGGVVAALFFSYENSITSLFLQSTIPRRADDSTHDTLSEERVRRCVFKCARRGHSSTWPNHDKS